MQMGGLMERKRQHVSCQSKWYTFELKLNSILLLYGKSKFIHSFRMYPDKYSSHILYGKQTKQKFVESNEK